MAGWGRCARAMPTTVSAAEPPDRERPDRAAAWTTQPTPSRHRRGRRRRRRRGAARTWLAVALSAFGVLIVVVVVAGFLIHLPVRDHLAGRGDAARRRRSSRSTARRPTSTPATSCSSPCASATTTRPCGACVTRWLDPDRDVEKRSDVVGCLSRRREHDDQHAPDAAVAGRREGRRADAPRLHGRRPTRREITVVEVCRACPRTAARRSGDQVARGRRHAGDRRSTTSVPLVQRAPARRARRRHRRPRRHDEPRRRSTTGRVADGRADVRPGAAGRRAGTACLGVVAAGVRRPTTSRST